MTEETNVQPTQDETTQNTSRYQQMKAKLPVRREDIQRASQHVKENFLPACKEKADKSIVQIDHFIQYIGRKDSGTDNEALNIARRPIVFGLWIIIIVLGFFGLWAAIAPLDSAAIARGVVVLNDNKKTIQHLEGGIIDELLVSEGDFVKKGQPLIRLSETAAKARLDLVIGQLLAARAAENRLTAERDSSETITFDKELLEKAKHNVEIKKIVDSQQNLFIARKNAINGQVDILKQRIAQFDDEINGLKAQEASTDNQLGLINEEISIVQQLLAKGNAQKPRLLALQRRGAELEGIKGEYQARIAKAGQAITEAELEITNITTKFINEVVDDLKETQVQLADLEERRRAAQDIMDRIVIIAPRSGIVTDLQFHTTGGVISPGAKILDIVPQDDKLIIEAHVSPTDRDIVHQGLRARVRLTAYKTRRTPILEGKLLSISPDRFVDQATRESYYKARIRINEKQLKSLKDVELQPGMPADVLIVTGTRTMMSYLFSPITDSFRKAFREQ